VTIGQSGVREASCPHGLCDGSGWILAEDDAAQPCRCRETRLSRSRSQRMGSGIPKRFRDLLREASFDRNPVRGLDPLILDEVRRFTRHIDKNLGGGVGRWFEGDVGTGKTMLAMLISKAALDNGHSVAIYSVPGLLAQIQETYDDNSNHSYMDLFRRLCTVDLLHLDDLGTERPTDWVVEQLYSIVNERWQDKRSIVVTTNLAHDELRKQLGARTVSRLFGICGEPLQIMGEDQRQRSAPELGAPSWP